MSARIIFFHQVSDFYVNIFVYFFGGYSCFQAESANKALKSLEKRNHVKLKRLLKIVFSYSNYLKSLLVNR